MKTGSVLSYLFGLLFPSKHQRIEREIYDRIGTHLNGEKKFDYSFTTEEEMEERTEAFNVQDMLDTVEEHIDNMPRFYGKAFRHIVHRDLHERLRMYEHLARRRRHRKEGDPRFIATHA